jgi:hypothetical protein
VELYSREANQNAARLMISFGLAVRGLARVIRQTIRGLLNVLLGTLQYEIRALFTNHNCRGVGVS